MRKTQEEYYNNKGGCLILTIKITLITIILILFSIKSNAQKSINYNPPKGWGEPELFVPLLCIGSTFAVNQYKIVSNTGNKFTGAGVAAIGLTITAITHFALRKIRTNKNNRKHRKYKY